MTIDASAVPNLRALNLRHLFTYPYGDISFGERPIARRQIDSSAVTLIMPGEACR